MLRIKMMIRKNLEIMPALILISIVLSGCSKTPEPEIVKTGNTNQSAAASNNASVPAVNVPVNPPNAPVSVANNTSAPNANRDVKSSPPVKDPTPQIGSGGNDLVLFTQVRGAMSSDQELMNAVTIEIKEGNVTLGGNVSSVAQKTKAGQLAQTVKGVKGVKNNLRVAP